ncbi:MAG: TonB-dependent receptor [Candidatus Eisenbacteria bacterium]
MSRIYLVFTVLTAVSSLILVQRSFSNVPVWVESSDVSSSDSTQVPTYYLERIVVTASRYERNSFALPQTVSIATRDGIERGTPQTFSDLLRDMPGVDLSDAGPFRTRPVIRGMFGSRVLILVDGEPLNNTRESTFSGAELALLDVDQTERVEVVHGPGSVLYGSDALGGVINIITRKPVASGSGPLGLGLAGRLQLGYATVDEQKRMRLEFGSKVGSLDFLLGGGFREASDYKSPDGTVINSGLGRADDLNFKADYGFLGKHRLGLDVIRFRADEIGYPGTPNEQMPRLFFPFHNRDKVALEYEAKNLSPRLPSLRAGAYYQKLAKEFDSDLTIPAGPGMKLNSFSQTFSEVERQGLSFQQLFLTSKDRFSILGFEYHRESVDGNRISRTTMSLNDTTVVFDIEDESSTVPKNNLDAIGVFLSNELSLLERSVVTSGLRYDYFRTRTERTPDYMDTRLVPPQPFESRTQNLSSLNGSLGLVHRLSNHINLVGNVASAYRAPNVVEKYFFGRASGSEFVIPNYDLKPEKSANTDLGVKFSSTHFGGSVAFFQSWFRDFIELESTGDSVEVSPGEFLDEWHYINIAKAQIRGVEAELKGTLPRNFFGFCNVTYTRGHNTTLDQPLFVPPLKLVVRLGWKQRDDRFRIESNLRYVAEQNRVPKDSEGKYIDRLPTPSFTLLSLESSLRLFKGQTLAVRINNLTNETYSEPYNASSPYNPVVEPGRNLVVSLSTTF